MINAFHRGEPLIGKIIEGLGPNYPLTYIPISDFVPPVKKKKKKNFVKKKSTKQKISRKQNPYFRRKQNLPHHL